jgi:hypothetical protein
MSFSYSSTRTRTTPPGGPFLLAGECAITAATARPRAPVCERARARIGTSREFVARVTS